MKCTISHCSRDAIARGLCVNHYYAFRKYGDPLKVVQKQYHGLTLKERFERYVIKRDGCWEWSGSTDARGYCRLNVNGTPQLAHRISFRLHFGDFPDEMTICHKCDNPTCTNPEHLFLGTQATNVADMHQKGRARKRGKKGDDHHAAKLTDADVRLIRSSSEPTTALATRFNVSRPTIHAILVGKTWTHVK